MERIKEFTREWVKPGVIISFITIVIGIQTYSVNRKIKDIKYAVSLNDTISLETTISFLNKKIDDLDEKIDDLKVCQKPLSFSF